MDMLRNPLGPKSIPFIADRPPPPGPATDNSLTTNTISPSETPMRSAAPSFASSAATASAPIRAAARNVARPQPELWGKAGVEPSVEELMADPMAALLLRRDGIGRGDVLAAVADARRALATAPPAPPTDAPTWPPAPVCAAAALERPPEVRKEAVTMFPGPRTRPTALGRPLPTLPRVVGAL